MGSSRRAAAVWVANASTRASLHPQANCISMLENGVELSRFTPTPWPEAPSASNPLRIVFVGRLIPVKGVPMLLEAIERVRKEFPVEAEILGDGPMRGEWEQEARARGVADIVKFAGNRSLDEVAEAMRRAHLFCLPSVRESGGAVLLEAMASNRPVAAVAYGGPAEVVDDGVGAAIAPTGRASVVESLVEVLRDVVRNPDAWRRRGEEGRRRAEREYGWDAKVDRAVEFYRKTRENAESAERRRGIRGSSSMDGMGER
jgi:glycosyltransferase involved in cell wall biosynthesis